MAAYLEHLHGDQAPQIAVRLAYHYERGQNKEKALVYLTKAGDQARSAHAYSAALDFYGRAEGLAGALDDVSALHRFHERQADLYDVMGQFDEALRYYGLALTSAGADAKPLRRAQIGRRMGRVQTKQGKYDTALATLTVARKELDTTRVTLNRATWLELARVEEQAGWAQLFRGDYSEASACCDRAQGHLGPFAEIRDEGLDWQQSEIEILRGHIYYRRGRFDQAAGHFERSLALKQGLEDRPGQAVAHDNLGFVCQAQGDLTGALEHHHKSLKIRRESGSMAGMAASLHNLGAVHLQRGEYDQAIQYLEEMVRVCQEIGMPAFLPQTHQLLSEAYLARGEAGIALQHARAASRAAAEVPAAVGPDMPYRLLSQLDKTLITL